MLSAPIEQSRLGGAVATSPTLNRIINQSLADSGRHSPSMPRTRLSSTSTWHPSFSDSPADSPKGTPGGRPRMPSSPFVFNNHGQGPAASPIAPRSRLSSASSLTFSLSSPGHSPKPARSRFPTASYCHLLSSSTSPASSVSPTEQKSGSSEVVSPTESRRRVMLDPIFPDKKTTAHRGVRELLIRRAMKKRESEEWTWDMDSSTHSI
jgi:hypothetical protein